MTAELINALNHLKSKDSVMADLIARYPAPSFAAHNNYYQDLVEDIIGQQLSVKAAAAIRKRFVALFDDKTPMPEQILEVSVEDLRAVGLSRPKAGYIKDLAEHVLDGRLSFDNFESLSNDKIITKLIDVKGIGEWTAHMFLMFCMGRLDVLASGDLGIRNGLALLYNLKSIPIPDEVKQLSEKKGWHPYQSVACWYIWASLDNKPSN